MCCITIWIHGPLSFGAFLAPRVSGRYSIFIPHPHRRIGRKYRCLSYSPGTPIRHKLRKKLLRRPKSFSSQILQKLFKAGGAISGFSLSWTSLINSAIQFKASEIDCTADSRFEQTEVDDERVSSNATCRAETAARRALRMAVTTKSFSLLIGIFDIILFFQYQFFVAIGDKLNPVHTDTCSFDNSP